ncbi:MAG: glycosyltransferase family 4 protein [Thermoplasmata archaeon]|nr:glycosyltransferase family 4 protein [Thermoplasmata archaeon]
MKICMIAARFSVDYIDPRVHKEAVSLVNNGHEVYILAPSIKPSIETLGKIKILNISGGKGIFNRPHINLIRKGLELQCDVYHCHGDLILVGSIIKMLSGKKIVYDVHDDYPSLHSYSSNLSDEVKPLLKFLIYLKERFLTLFADYVITVNKTLKQKFVNRGKSALILYNSPLTKPYNESHSKKNNKLPSYELLKKLSKLKRQAQTKLVVYEGKIGNDRGLKQLLQALLITKKKTPNVKLLIVGNIADEEQKVWVKNFLIQNKLEDNIIITSWVSIQDVPKYLGYGDVGVILFQPTSYNNIIGLPNKLFDYMAAKLPVVASNFPEMQKAVKGNGCGICVDPTNPSEIAEALVELLVKNPDKARAMGLQGYKMMKNKYGWPLQEQKLIKLYENIGSCIANQ